jgi:hypothetical protein
MGELLNIIPYALILSDIWPCIQVICPIEDKVALLFNLCMFNSTWKQLIDKSKDRFDYQVFFEEYLFQQQQLEKDI